MRIVIFNYRKKIALVCFVHESLFSHIIQTPLTSDSHKLRYLFLINFSNQNLKRKYNYLIRQSELCLPD